MHKSTLLLLLALLATPTVAQVETTTETTLEDQSTEQTYKGRDIEKVEVTGSLIKRVDVEGPAAVQTFDKEYIEKTGWNNLGDMMRDLSANSLGVTQDSAGSSSPGSQTANLGGLGPSRTLVLIDGRRAPRDGSLSGFDLSLMPMGAIERFDIMTDAGSALYGTDAIGGVINIITKKNFNGFDFSVSHFNSVKKGGDRSSSNFTYGQSNSKGNFTTSFTVRNNQKIKSRDRDTLNIVDSFNAPAANYSYVGNDLDDNGKRKTAFGGNVNNACDSQGNSYVKGSNCRYKFNNVKDTKPQVKQVSNVTNYNYDLTSSTSIFGTLLGSYKEVDYVYAPGVVALSVSGDTIDGYGLGNNAGEAVDIYWRSDKLGNRITNTQERMVGTNVGLRTYMFDTWEASVIVGADSSLRKNNNPLGFSNKEKIIGAIEDGSLNPFTNEGVIPDSFRETPFQNVGSTSAYVEARATGEIADGWAGPIGMAFGTGYVYESINIEIDSLSASNNVTGGGASSAGKGQRRSQFAVAEINIPAAKGLEVQAATRFDNFDTFGETINPKIGVAYRPFSKVLLRATAGTGFKAPNLTSLYSGSEGYPTFYDYGVDDSRQYRTQYAPNLDLQPETSRNITIGAVVEPFNGLSFSIDYFDNKINDQIQLPDEQRINNDEAAGIDIERKYGVAPSRGPDGSPTYIIKRINTHEVINRRMQFGIQAQKFVNGFGKISLRNDTSYMFKYTEQFFEDDPAQDLFTLVGNPKWRNNAILSYAPTNSLSFDAGFNTTGSSFKERGVTRGKFNMYTRIDLAANIGLIKNTAMLRVGVQDLTGENPPFDPLSNDPTSVDNLYDYTGTRFFASYRQTF
jgi:iron complex outermembrane receptor protein